MELHIVSFKFSHQNFVAYILFEKKFNEQFFFKNKTASLLNNNICILLYSEVLSKKAQQIQDIYTSLAETFRINYVDSAWFVFVHPYPYRLSFYLCWKRSHVHKPILFSNGLRKEGAYLLPRISKTRQPFCQNDRVFFPAVNKYAVFQVLSL